jgi:phage head maturation protease
MSADVMVSEYPENDQRAAVCLTQWQDKGEQMPTPRTDQLSLGADNLERKELTHLEVKDADKGQVEAVFSTFNVIDHDGDVILEGAFKNGAEVRISAYGHRSWMGELPVGRGKIRAEKDRAVLEGEFFMNTTAGRETFEVIKQMGALQEYSYSLDDIETGLVSDLPEELQGAVRAIRKVRVHEVSPVLAGASLGTQTLSVKQEKVEDKKDDAEQEDAAIKELARFERTRNRLLLHSWK